MRRRPSLTERTDDASLEEKVAKRELAVAVALLKIASEARRLFDPARKCNDCIPICCIGERDKRGVGDSVADSTIHHRYLFDLLCSQHSYFNQRWNFSILGTSS